MKSLLAGLKGSKFASGIAVLAGGAAVGQLILLAASPALTRLYTPADFATLGLYISILTIVVVGSSLRYELAIPVARSQPAAQVVVALCFLLLAVVTGIVTPVFAINWWYGFFWDERAAFFLMIFVPLGTMLVGTYQILSYWAIRQKQFALIARTKLYQAVMACAAQLGLGVLGVGLPGLLSGQLLGQASGSLSFAKLLARDPQARKGSLTWRRVLALARKYRAYAFVSLPASMLSSVTLNLPAIAMVTLYSGGVAGGFVLAQRVIATPLVVLGNAVAQAYYGTASELCRSNSGGLRILFVKTSMHLALVGLAPTLVILSFGEEIFSIVFGKEWNEAGLLARFMIVGFYFQFVVSPLSQSLNIIQRQRLHLIWGALRLSVIVLLILGAFFFSLEPLALVAVLSVTMAAFYAVLFFVCFVALKGF